LEKFSTWTNNENKFRSDGNLLEKFTLDELLDNIMLYWVTNSLTTSVRLYAENLNKSYMALKIDQLVYFLFRSSLLQEDIHNCFFFILYAYLIFRLPINVPSACAIFPHELLYVPEKMIRSKYINLIHYNHLPRGGHFAAFEEPALLAGDIFEFVSKVQDIKKKVDKKDVPNTGKKMKEPTKT